MIRMKMGEECLSDLGNGDAGLRQLAHHSVTSIDKVMRPIDAQQACWLRP
jgi:hypothetical protein